MGGLTHLDEKGRARMVDVSEKPPTARAAAAHGRILMRPATLKLIKGGKIKKGDVFTVANVSAVMAAKRAWETIPMCHPLHLSGVEVAFTDGRLPRAGAFVGVTATVKCVGPTGVEMEALAAVSAALLTVYDMCKAIDRGMRITDIELLEKKGGRSGHWKRDEGGL
ncbi:MAG: cyclic pyranopterin monophosphate synthase MoaC [Deltaproteobacteria bacterium]|nr:cyclic pyranopterin monophosphate synthase MoaC [Deltaproteobacteria bacterium]